MRTMIILLLMWFGLGPEISAQQDQQGRPVELVVVLVYADWCEECDEISETFEELKEEWHQNRTYFRKFDISDEFTRTGTKQFAELMGLEEVLDSHESDTGHILFVDAPEREVIKTFEPGNKVDDIHSEIQRYLEK